MRNLLRLPSHFRDIGLELEKHLSAVFRFDYFLRQQAGNEEMNRKQTKEKDDRRTLAHESLCPYQGGHRIISTDVYICCLNNASS